MNHTKPHFDSNYYPDEKNIRSTALIVDDEKNIRTTIKLALEDVNIHSLPAHDVSQALRYLKENIIDVIVLDIQIGLDSGLDFYHKIKTLGFECPVVFISGHASLDQAAMAVKVGAYDFVEKPFSAHKIATTVKRALEHGQMTKELFFSTISSKSIIGNSPLIEKIKSQAIKVSKTAATVHIQGESGSGKEAIAHLIHANSQRKNQAFIKVNCSAIPENLIESELFGYEKGAFTGADKTKKGLFELAHRGTIFLDEVADLALSAQAKILRVLQEGEIQRLGSENTLKTDVRVISASHKNLKQQCEQSLFREDLFFRLNVIPIEVPSLSQRLDDIPKLAHYFMKEICHKHNLKEKNIHESTFALLKTYSWPGNIRELRNIIERMIILGGELLLPHDLPDEITSFDSNKNFSVTSHMSLKEFKNKSEYEFIIKTLKDCYGNISKAATELSITRSYLHKRMKQLNIQKKDYLI